MKYTKKKLFEFFHDEVDGYLTYMKAYKDTGDIRFKKMAMDEKKHQKILRGMVK